MPPRLVHLVRHAQGYHNINWQFRLRDPILTDLGHSQCQTLASTFPHHDSITHIICSPLKRTIQTTLESFHPTITRLVSENKEFKIRMDPYFQEIGEWECDIGSTIPEVQEFLSNVANGEEDGVKVNTPPGYEHHTRLDFSQVETLSPEWPGKVGIFAATNVEERGAYARNFLFDNFKEDEEVVIVSHGGYLHVLSEDWDNYDELNGTAWLNTERRSFVVKKNAEGKVKLEETEESIKNRWVHAEDTDSGTERRETEVAGHHGSSKN